MVRSSINKAFEALGVAPPALRRLIRAGVLVGDLDLPPMERWVEYDPRWTRLDIWRHRVARGFAFSDETGADEALAMKKLLRCGDEPLDDDFLLAFGRALGGRPLLKAEARARLGSWRVAKAACERYAELHGHASDRQVEHAPMCIEDLIADAPEPLRLLPGTCLDEDRGILFERPDERLVGRVGAMPRDHLRSVATLAILVHPTHGGMKGRLPRMLALIERLRPEIGDGLLSDGDLTADAVRRAFVEGRAEPDAASIGVYEELRELIVSYLGWQPPRDDWDEEGLVASLLPAELPTDLRSKVRDERERVTVAALRARALTAGAVARRASERMTGLMARFRQWDRLTDVIDDAVASIERDFAEGRDVFLPVGVSDTFEVVRPDGTIAPGLRQTVRMEIVSEEMLWLEAAHASGWDPAVDSYLSASSRSQSPARIEAAGRKRRYRPAGDGQNYEPGAERRLHVRYVGTEPADGPDDEHYPPFLVDLYHVSALVTSTHMSSAQRLARSEVVDRLGLEWAPQAMMGLTWWPVRRSHSLAHLVLRHSGQVVLPYRQLRLMLAYGCAVGRLEMMSGVRIGETMQARHGGCFANARCGDRTVATMRGRPKGWPRDRIWIIDAITMALLRSIKGWVIANWYADLGALPLVDYGERKKNEERLQCPPARYLFQIGGRAADNEELNRCLRIATVGMTDARSHDYRYAFAKLLKLRRASRRQSARAMSHDEASPSVDRYRDWDCEGLEEGDLIVAEHQDQLEREMLEALIDAA